MTKYLLAILGVFICFEQGFVRGTCLDFCDSDRSGRGTKNCYIKTTCIGYTTRRCGFLWGKTCITGSYTRYLSKKSCCPISCKVNGHWGSWSSWSSSQCSATCGAGTQTYKRRRNCNDPTPKNGGNSCHGSAEESLHKYCSLIHCRVNGGWSSWESWSSVSSCSVTCGKGIMKHTRKRFCNNPRPKYGGTQCSGMAKEGTTKECYAGRHCPVDGSWGNWTEWIPKSPCSVTCGLGIQVVQKKRMCDHPKPTYGGKDCIGEPEKKTEKACSIGTACPEKGSIKCMAKQCSEYGRCGCSFGFYGDGFTCTGSRGKQFLVLFMENAIDYFSIKDHFSKLYIASRSNSIISLKTSSSLPTKMKNKLSKSFRVKRSQADIKIPVHMRAVDMKTEKKGILVETSETTSLFAVNHDGWSSDSTLILPVERLGRRYIVGSSAPFNSRSSDYNSQVGFVAAEDGTTVTMTLNIAGGHELRFKNKTYKSGQTMQFHLEKYEDFQLSDSHDLTGTLIESSKPIAVFAGNKCNKLNRFGYCSHLVEQLPPTNNLDKTFIVPPSLLRTGGLIRVVAVSKTNIEYQIDGAKTKKTLENSQYCDIEVKDKSITYIKADKPVLVLSFAVRIGRRGGGDPYMTLVPGLQQYIHQYHVAIPRGFKTNYMTIMISSKSKTYLRLNMKKVSPNSILSDKCLTIDEGKYCTMIIKVGGGAHQVETTDGTRFGLLIHGQDQGDGYGYAANVVSPGIV